MSATEVKACALKITPNDALSLTHFVMPMPVYAGPDMQFVDYTNMEGESSKIRQQLLQIKKRTVITPDMPEEQRRDLAQAFFKEKQVVTLSRESAKCLLEDIKEDNEMHMDYFGEVSPYFVLLKEVRRELTRIEYGLGEISR